MYTTCEWYDYKSRTCNQDDKNCPYALDNELGTFFLDKCDKLIFSRDIGDTFELNGVRLDVAKASGCSMCHFNSTGCTNHYFDKTGECDTLLREDNTNVIFKKV